jgi:heme oxygenase
LFGEGDEGRSFFRGDRGTGSRWRGFLAALAQDCDDTALPQMIAGAETGFALFERCLAT